MLRLIIHSPLRDPSSQVWSSKILQGFTPNNTIHYVTFADSGAARQIHIAESVANLPDNRSSLENRNHVPEHDNLMRVGGNLHIPISINKSLFK